VEHQDSSLDPVSLDQKPTLGTEPIGAYELGTARDERPGTARHIESIMMVNGQMIQEELIDFLLKAPV